MTVITNELDWGLSDESTTLNQPLPSAIPAKNPASSPFSNKESCQSDKEAYLQITDRDIQNGFAVLTINKICLNNLEIYNDNAKYIVINIQDWSAEFIGKISIIGTSADLTIITNYAITFKDTSLDNINKFYIYGRQFLGINKTTNDLCLGNYHDLLISLNNATIPTLMIDASKLKLDGVFKVWDGVINLGAINVEKINEPASIYSIANNITHEKTNFGSNLDLGDVIKLEGNSFVINDQSHGPATYLGGNYQFENSFKINSSTNLYIENNTQITSKGLITLEVGGHFWNNGNLNSLSNKCNIEVIKQFDNRNNINCYGEVIINQINVHSKLTNHQGASITSNNSFVELHAAELYNSGNIVGRKDIRMQGFILSLDPGYKVISEEGNITFSAAGILQREGLTYANGDIHQIAEMRAATNSILFGQGSHTISKNGNIITNSVRNGKVNITGGQLQGQQIILKAGKVITLSSGYNLNSATIIVLDADSINQNNGTIQANSDIHQIAMSRRNNNSISFGLESQTISKNGNIIIDSSMSGIVSIEGGQLQGQQITVDSDIITLSSGNLSSPAIVLRADSIKSYYY